MANFETFSFTVAAGSVRRLDFQGDFVACLESNLATFRIALDGQPAGKFAQGIELRKPYQYIEVFNDGSSGLVVMLALGSAEFSDRRLITSQAQSPFPITLGDIKKRGFLATCGVGGTAGQYAHGQLFNPALSGKILAVSQIAISVPAAGQVGIKFYNTELDPSGQGTVSSVSTDGGSSVAVARIKENASTLGGISFQRAYVGANQSVFFNFDNPLLIHPGKGVMALFAAIATYMDVCYQFTEIDA